MGTGQDGRSRFLSETSLTRARRGATRRGFLIGWARDSDQVWAARAARAAGRDAAHNQRGLDERRDNPRAPPDSARGRVRRVLVRQSSRRSREGARGGAQHERVLRRLRGIAQRGARDRSDRVHQLFAELLEGCQVQKPARGKALPIDEPKKTPIRDISSPSRPFPRATAPPRRGGLDGEE
jgi:hypothetical protein